jgi:serine/threonine protein kinase
VPPGLGTAVNARNTMTNFTSANYDNSANPHRGQLQNRQTRRLVTPAAGTRDENARDQEAGQGGNNYAHLAYHVEKHPDPADPGVDLGGDANQFCTDESSIENIDNYIIGKRIGQGAYAVVRVGLHKLLNQKIAVKIYEKFKLLEPNRRKSVKREIKIMEKIDHECLAKLYEAFESHKQVFLIMEYVNGGSLHGYLKGKPNRQMAEIEAKFLWQQVVYGIHYLHQRNVTHRDIKLENVLLDETRTRVKLIDFGFSTCIPHEKKVRIFCGTPSYMAPEIVSKVEYAGPPADIWALGVLLYALLCGRFPFKGANDKELYQNICKQDLPMQEHISRPAKQILLRIFHKNPEKRPSTKDLLRDPWLQFTPRDQEMMSPKSLAFIGRLKVLSGINFGHPAAIAQQKMGFNRTMNNFSRPA